MPATRRLLTLAAAACFGAAAHAAPAGDAIDARYQKERAACENGTSGQDTATCLREAGAARDAARRGQLDPAPQADANATERCQALPEADRAHCLSRVNGGPDTTTSGSVKGGGVLKETTTRYVTLPNGEKRRID